MTRWHATSWAAAIRAGMRAKDMSVERAAAHVGVPMSTFRTWLDGRHLPRVTVFDHWPALAELANVSESELLRIAGVLPDAFSGSLLLAQATRELRQGLDHTRQLLRQASSLAQSSSVAQVVNELSSSGIDWETRLRSAIRGNDVRLVYHHYVGVVAPEQLRAWGIGQVRDYIRNDVLAHIWRPLSLYWRVGAVHDWEDAPELLIQVPEQESSRPPTGGGPRPDDLSILVLCPPWGYGELLASLLADSLGYGNIDFRYFGLPEDEKTRLDIVQSEIDNCAPGFALTVPPLMLLAGLRIGAPQLRRTLPVLITYEDKVRARASQIYRTTLEDLAGDADEGISRVRSLCTAALRELPTGSRYVHVSLADDDLVVDETVNRDRVNDAVAWLALTTLGMILEDRGERPLPVAGPLRGLLQPSGRMRRPPDMASRVDWRTVD